MSLTVVCDLDGVVYLGNSAVPGSAAAIERLRSEGVRVLFATNNSARPPEQVAAKMKRVGEIEAAADMIVTSSIVAAGMITRGPVFVAGELGVETAVRRAGFDLTDDPAKASTVVAGLDRGLSYDRVAAAADAIRGGARLIATNRDPTFPTDRGLLPGAGACIAAIEAAAGVTGQTAGKPTAHMRRHIEAMAEDGPIWMVGDREDTDIALAKGDRWRSVLVLTGVSGQPEAKSSAATLVAADLAEAVDVILAGDQG